MSDLYECDTGSKECTVQNPPGNFALTMNYGKQAISRELVRLGGGGRGGCPE